ncbi:relaxase/mobilization nuclease domain-containing protein [Dysgonomonas sp. HDW5A]|uniref:relaxase/mobilization nuclease domain-containing protein n=1 Tax=Dysgonomonas sp. HDW5A TaxID=2714926 RepID=UPI002103D463|nr:relaxase/mobilization nuclease domain-containing protein [Dysgonomonas sp. HDW5A]
MIAKNIKGKSFKGCVQYVMNETAELLEAEGVWADNAKEMIRSFAMQRSGRKEIKRPVGHIPISFAPEDSHRLTCNFMLQLAKEYMEEMGIKNTQYIIVRHHNTDNDHLHIVYNRIDNNLKLISVNHDYKRNIKVCKKLKDKYNLTYGKGKSNVKREKLDNPDRAKYYIYDAIKSVLPNCKTPTDLRFALQELNIEVEYKHKRTIREIEGVSFRYDNISFKGSQVDRKFSFGNLQKEFDKNIELLEERTQEQKEKQLSKVEQQAEDKLKLPVIGGVELTSEQWHTLKEGGFVYLENIRKKDGSGLFSSYVFLNEERNKAFFSKKNPDVFVKFGRYEMCIRDKILIENGYVTKAKVKWYGGEFAYPYL